MDRERAETHLRLLCEEALRRATAHPSDGISGSQPEAEAARSAGVTETPVGGAAVPDAFMALLEAGSAERAVINLYSTYYGSLVRLAALLVQDVETAEKVVRDSFAALHDGWHRLKYEDTALAYLRQTVVQRSCSVLRRVSGGVHRERMLRVARALTAVGALDDQVATQILEDFELALAIRQAGSRGWRGPGPGSWMRSSPGRSRQAMPMSSGPPAPGMPKAAGAGTGPANAPGSAGPGTAPGRAVRLGQMIPVRGEDGRGELYLLSHAQTASGPQLSVFAWARYPRGPLKSPTARPGQLLILPSLGVADLEQFTATDERGTRYKMRVRDLGGGPDGWTLMMDPSPPHDPRWLDLITTPGEPAVRIDLTRPSPTPTVTVSAAAASPGEHLLHAIGARLLAEPPAVPPDSRLQPVAPGPGPATSAADGLGDVITALQAAGAVSPLSPVPGQLAALHPRPQRNERRDRAAPGGNATAERHRHLDRSAGRWAIGRSPYHPAAPLGVHAHRSVTRSPASGNRAGRISRPGPPSGRPDCDGLGRSPGPTPDGSGSSAARR